MSVSNLKYKLDLQMFTEETNRVSIDLTQLSGYASLAYGSYTLTVKAKATGYEDSVASTGVSWTKVNPLPQLGTPVISLDSDDLTIETAEGAEYCDVYVNGTLQDTIDIRPATLISFTIQGVGSSVQYQAEEGMTWAEWVDSEYNIDGYYYSSTEVLSAIGLVVYLNNEKVSSNATIIASGEYDLIGGGDN